MRYLAQGATRLDAFTLPMKLALTFFLLFMLLSLASSLALYHQQTAFSVDRAQKYYRGNAGSPDPGRIYVAKSYRRLLEVSHFHLFIMPVVYLAFVHLYFLSRRPGAEKVAMTLGAFGGLGAEVATPWLVRYVAPGWAWVFWVSGSLITLTTLWMCGVCLRGLWFAGGGDESEFRHG